MRYQIISTLLLLVPMGAVAQAQPSFLVVDLGANGEDFSQAIDINELGQVTGTVGCCASNSELFLWLPEADYGMDAGMTIIGHHPGVGSPLTSFGRINDLGQIAGRTFGSSLQGFLWLPEPDYGFGEGWLTIGTSNSFCRSINNMGVVTGGNFDGSGLAFTWQNGSHTNLPGLSGACGVGEDINALGEVVGPSFLGGSCAGAQNGVLWLPAPNYDLMTGVNDLGSLGGNAQPVAINDLGQVVGAYNSFNQAFIWLPSKAYGLPEELSPLGTLGGSSANANNINNQGWIVGRSLDVTESPKAFLWVDGVMYDLNDLLVSSPGWDLKEAFGLNDQGQIVGVGTSPGGDDHAFLLNLTTLFLRGDSDGDGSVSVLPDTVSILAYLFQGGTADCVRSSDVNDDGAVTLTDAFHLLCWTFCGGPPPAAPFPVCGADASADSLSCDQYVCP